MAIVTSTVTGRVLLPNDTAYTDGVLSFQLSETDVDSEAVIPTGRLSVTLDGDDIPAGFTLWRNTRGLRGTYYTVTLAATIVSEVGNGRTISVRKTFSLGTCQVGAESTYTIGALLGDPVGDAADWKRQVRYWDTRANFVTWAGANDPYVGTVVFTEGIAYRFIDSGTAIGDLPGWVIQTSGTSSIQDSAVTNAKLANMAQATFKMRASGAGSGNPIDGTATQAKTALAIAGSDVTMSGGGTAADYAGFNTRAAFVTWASGKTPATGTVIYAAGNAYRYIGSGTAISDLAGWIPHGPIWLDHWNVDMTGATNNLSQMVEAFTYAKGFTLNIPPGIVAFTHNGSAISDVNTDGTHVIGAGIGRTTIRMSVPSTTFAAAFNWTAGRCRWSDFTFEFPTLANCSAAFVNFAGLDNRFERVRWVGGVTGSGTASHSAYILNHSTTADVDGLTVVDCEEESTTYGFLKSNTNTRATKRVSIMRHRSKNCYKSPMSNINSPSGSLKDVFIEGGVFEQDASRGVFPIVVGIATANNVTISGIRARGFWGDVIHIEEKARVISITNCNAEISGGSFITLTANNISGSYDRPEQVVISNVQAEQIASQTGDGLRLTYDAGSISSATNVVASNGIFKNFTNGIVIGTRGEDNIRLSNFLLSNCAYGIYYTGDATLDVEGFTFANCTTAIKSERGGLADNCTFYDCTSTHQVAAGILQLRNPKFNYGLDALAAASYNWRRLVKGITRAQGTAAFRAYQSNTNKNDAVYQLNWDGTTETTTLLSKVASGALDAAVVLVDEASAVTISAGGTGYTVGNVLTVQGGTLETNGTRTTATVTTVSSGVVTGVSISNVGEWATAPAGAAATTGGSGTGCTLTLTTVKSACMRIFAASALTVHISANVDGSVYVV
jgi:hypothetical protein